MTATEIERAFQRERSRVDRNGQSFSVVVFHVIEKRKGDVKRAANSLLGRVRDYDDVGVVAPGRLAVLLPEAIGADAWTFADHAMSRLAEAGMAVNCEVFSYPHPGTDDEDAAVASDMVRLFQTDGDADAEEHAGGEDASGRTPEVIETGSNGRPTMVAALATAEPASEAPRPPMLRAVSGEAPPAPEPEPAIDPALVAGPRRVHDLSDLFEEPLPFYRRVVDIAAASTALVILSPVLLGAAIAVKTTSPGPLIYWQWRAGRGGRPFRFYKFRSMYQNADERKNELRLVNEKDGPIFKIKNDPRITPVGRVIRALSIDELPQLVNVLKGDMTLVGPRPPVMDEVEDYEAWQRQRLDVTGGITCIWQVSGRSEVTFREWMRMDVRYRKQRSLGLDLRLIGKTFGAVLSRRGAY